MFVILYNLLQTIEVEDRMYSALDDYRSGSEEVGYKEEVNDVVAYVQNTVCTQLEPHISYLFLFSLHPYATPPKGFRPHDVRVYMATPL